ncbi:MAG: hypothetical protein MIO90_03415 [Methanomassiliicoccales archaeon]|nr:hypothetical protein [Methanomassiliicoccales archaeon]
MLVVSALLRLTILLRPSRILLGGLLYLISLLWGLLILFILLGWLLIP